MQKKMKKERMKMTALTKTNFNFPKQSSVYHGKVRDVYTIANDLVVMIASDRISAFDHILPKGIPFKGQVLNQVARFFLEETRDIVPNWLEASPDPMVAIGKKCEPIRVEMVIRGYLAGHAAREYKLGKRILCGVSIADGMMENDPFPEPIITPAAKAEEGHDEDISKEDILSRGLVSKEIYETMERYTHKLFERGSIMAKNRGLILVDTKYEFGLYNGEVILIDEIHTPDSSRYFYAEGYERRQKNKEAQIQLSKEFVREWLIQNKFQGKDGDIMPDMTVDFIASISNRYIELYERITGREFIKETSANVTERIEHNVVEYLKTK